MPNCAEQVQIPKYKAQAYNTPKTAHMFRQPYSITQLRTKERLKH